MPLLTDLWNDGIGFYDDAAPMALSFRFLCDLCDLLRLMSFEGSFKIQVFSFKWESCSSCQSVSEAVASGFQPGGNPL
jgi:hypothetical protein